MVLRLDWSSVQGSTAGVDDARTCSLSPCFPLSFAPGYEARSGINRAMLVQCSTAICKLVSVCGPYATMRPVLAAGSHMTWRSVSERGVHHEARILPIIP